MGAAVSNWRLARAVAQQGQLGVVSGTSLAVVHARLLQQGDPGGHLRRAFDHFPWPEIAERHWAEYFVRGGIPAGQPYRGVPMPTLKPNPRLVELTVLANFAEVFLAKEGHGGEVGINLLEKIQLPTLPSLYGAMLAGVDAVLMGAGIPRAIPGILDRMARGEPVEMRVDIEGAAIDDPIGIVRFDPRVVLGPTLPAVSRPRFIAIVASTTLAMTLAKKASGRVDGFVVESAEAGGHNAPPRGGLRLTAEGEPIYGPRDVVALPKIRALGLPFWLAGGFGRPGKLAEAQGHGAAGIQVGTAFALCDESGMLPDLKRRLREWVAAGRARVRTDALASPTGFPFKIAQLSQTLADAAACAKRVKVCDLGYLRKLFQRPDGTVGYRCPGEPEADFLHKGGHVSEVEGRKCLCNGLMATVGLGQRRRDGDVELPLVTAGDELGALARYFDFKRESFSAADVIRVLLGSMAKG